jgi:nicotinamide mononucleotide transporter
MLCLSGALWLLTGLTLRNFTDTDVPWWDAFPTAVSLVGQYLLARKRIENWLAWIAVNTVAASLFAWKSLWLTALLYLIFIALSVVGWRHWLARLKAENP